MKLYDGGATVFLIIGIIGLVIGGYGTFKEQPAPASPCAVWRESPVDGAVTEHTCLKWKGES